MCFKITLQRFRERQVNMKRISDECFVKTKPNKDNVIAIKICNGEMLFIGWMENAESYSMQISRNIDKCKLDKSELISVGKLYETITSSDWYKRLIIIDENSCKDIKQDYKDFITYVEDKYDGDHDIFEMTEEEFVDICDALADGDYVFVISDFVKN